MDPLSIMQNIVLGFGEGDVFHAVFMKGRGMRILRWILGLSIGCGWISVGYAEILGQYHLDIEFLRQQVKDRWEKEIFVKIPKAHQTLWRKRLQDVLNRMKQMKTTMWFEKKGRFRGEALIPGQSPSTSLGTWSRKGRLVEIKTTEMNSKQKSTMLCSVQSTTLRCHSPGSPLSMVFHKTIISPKKPVSGKK